MSKDARGKMDGVSMEELVKMTAVLTRAVNVGRAAIIGALRAYLKVAINLQEPKKERGEGLAI